MHQYTENQQQVLLTKVQMGSQSPFFKHFFVGREEKQTFKQNVF
jgi:hypothetical protein